jgi:hypothetical protein
MLTGRRGICLGQRCQIASPSTPQTELLVNSFRLPPTLRPTEYEFDRGKVRCQSTLGLNVMLVIDATLSKIDA